MLGQKNLTLQQKKDEALPRRKSIQSQIPEGCYPFLFVVGKTYWKIFNTIVLYKQQKKPLIANLIFAGTYQGMLCADYTPLPLSKKRIS